MKKIFLLILFYSFFTDQNPNLAAKERSWGYFLHTSRMTDTAIDEAFKRYGIIAVTGFRLDGEGNLTSNAAGVLKKLIPLSTVKNVILYPVITFTSAAQGMRLLKNRQAQARAIREISLFCGEWGLRGVHFDFEYCDPEYAPLLASFLAFFKSRYRGTLTMALFPPIEFPDKWSRFHDLRLISPHLDGIVIMCYDLHGPHTGPGPVTDVRWADRNIRHALKFMKPGQVWLGIPAYGYRWYGGTARAVSAREGVRLSKKYVTRRDISGNLMFSGAEGRDTVRVFISDRHSRKLLVELASRHGLAGIALWRIGFED